MLVFNYNKSMLKRVYLEITNSCNLNCPFCTNEKGNDFLEIVDIKNYIDQIKPYCNYIYLHILGEPLLHPNFEDILDYLDKKEMQLQLVSNGTLLYKHPNILKHACLRKLSISIHSVNNIDINDDYFQVINKLIDSNTNKNIELRFYDKNNLSEQLKQYLSYLKQNYSFEITSKTNSYKIKQNVFIYFEELFNWPNINDPEISDNGTCHGGIDMIAINSKSDVAICCLDPKAYNFIGNLKSSSLLDILNSDIYKNYVNQFKQNKITSELCKRCSYRLRFKA